MIPRDTVVHCTTSTRPAQPWRGMRIYEIETDASRPELASHPELRRDRRYRWTGRRWRRQWVLEWRTR